jgi:hypothetical protein
VILPSRAAYALIHVLPSRKAIKHYLGYHRLTTVQAHLHPVAANPYEKAMLPLADPQRLISGLHYRGVCHPSVPILRLTRSSEVSIPGTRNPNQNSVIMFQTGHWSTATPLFDIVLQHRYNNPKSHPYLVEISRM